MNIFHHITVLAEELVAGLCLRPGDCVIDCTAGGGGHTALMLAAVGSSGKVIAIDRDSAAIARLQERFGAELAAGTLQLHQGVFSDLEALVRGLGLVGKIRGIGADFGVSSPQLEQSERGFSLQQDGPLDMRMSMNGADSTAAELLAEASQEELADLFFHLGEEPKGRYFARKIVEARVDQPFTSTKQLADFIVKCSPYKGHSRKHPATKIFQALRIKVNDELGEISRLLTQAFEVLAPGGRLSMISFHSLEDRLVKHFFQDKAGKRPPLLPHLRDLPLLVLPGQEVYGRIIRPFPLIPREQEVHKNPRARSAKLRVLEKV